MSCFVENPIRRFAMAETVIGLFPQSREADDVVPMLTNRGYGRSDVELIGGHGAMMSGSDHDLVEKLSRLGVADQAQCDSLVEAISHGGAVIAARTPDQRKAEQIEELMLEHGATKCVHAPDTGWTTA
jgi:hypothetical protein